jgi:indole-3-glycerol phosphate synthase
MSDILHEICETKREHITICKTQMPESALAERAKSIAPPRGFLQALQQKNASPDPAQSLRDSQDDSHASFCERDSAAQNLPTPALIAEIKRASPSKGLIRNDFDPAAHAQAYAKGGAACLSVLTDAPYFQGHNDFVGEAHLACNLPILRKDFMLDPYQVTEARAISADGILLIMAALSDAQAQELEAAAFALGMDVLIEVHDDAELERALTHLKSPLIGINNRNLKTLEIDLNTSVRLRAHIPDSYTIVCESGIHSHADITRMQAHNMHCFLVGESLMLQRNIEQATKKLLTGQ